MQACADDAGARRRNYGARCNAEAARGREWCTELLPAYQSLDIMDTNRGYWLSFGVELVMIPAGMHDEGGRDRGAIRPRADPERDTRIQSSGRSSALPGGRGG